MGAAVVHWEINAKDAKKAQEFYAQLFGWTIDTNNPMNYGIVDTGLKMGINGGIGPVQGQENGFATFYVQVEDPQVYLDKAVGLGAKVIMPVTEVPNMVTYALFADPEGMIVGILKGSQTVKVEKPKPKPKRKVVRKKAVKKSKPKKRGRK